MILYFIRHPETTWDKKRLFQGIKEGNITLEGRSETLNFINNLSIKQIDKVFSANNQRCLYLAKKLTRKFPKSILIKNTDLNERSFGDLEGTSELEFANNTNYIFPNMKARYKWRPKNGESLEDVSIRVKKFLNYIKTNVGGNETVFVVTSGGFMKVVSYLLSIKTLGEAMETRYKNLELLKIVI
jgi:broad specificity phosphatase PhoE